MATEVTKGNGGGAVVNMKDYAKALQTGIADSRASTVIAGGGLPLLRLGRDGHWSFGQNYEEVQEGSSWAVNIMTLAHGYQCWVKDNPNDPNSKQTLKGEILVPMTEPKPMRPDPIQGKPFDEARAFQLKCIDGDDAGTEIQYKINSVGGLRAVDALLASIYKQLASDPTHAFPVIKLLKDSYVHKSWGPIAIPIFEIVGWTDTNLNPPDGDGTALEQDDETEDEDDTVSLAETEPEPELPRRRTEPVTASVKKKAPLQAVAPKPTAATRTGQRRRPGA